ncbi:hypothetical protein PG985_008120 [Apiospora marii]|uniref:Uncharacterized protein n=1 Tax=Apiospora marii TaxID=335849 RepID=A0ABR1R9Q7_9PEZI
MGYRLVESTRSRNPGLKFDGSHRTRILKVDPQASVSMAKPNVLTSLPYPCWPRRLHQMVGT